MRSDNELGFDSKKEQLTEDAADTKLFGYNILKVARLLNMIIGVGLTVCCGFNIVNIFEAFTIFTNPGKFFLNIFLL